MSNELAIAAVTATLRNLLASGIPDLPNQFVTTRPPDRARASGASPDQLNVFLYQTTLNPAWRNTVPPGIPGLPLALNLHYLITAFGEGDDDTRSHRWLGAAMRILHDHPLLGAREIRDALAESDLDAQIERVRITPTTMSLEEMSKLWTTFQTQYRISAAYQADVVLLDSKRPPRAVLPVLRRGEEDRGVETVPGIALPEIDAVTPPHGQSSALLGDEVEITGRNLAGLLRVRFSALRTSLGDPVVVEVAAGAGAVGTDTKVVVTLPNDAAAHQQWPAGFYTVALVVKRGTRGWVSNALGMALAPRIETITPANPVQRDANGNVTLTLTCTPLLRVLEVNGQKRHAQTVELALGIRRQVTAEPPTESPTTGKAVFRYHADAADLGKHWVRLRVDGVELPRIDRSKPLPEFDSAHQVEIA